MCKRNGQKVQFFIEKYDYSCLYLTFVSKEVIISYLVFTMDSFIACCDIFSQTLLVCIIYAIKKEIIRQICHKSFYLCVSAMGDYILSLSVHIWGVPHLHPIILSLVPCPFSGSNPVTGPRSIPMG